MEKDQQIQQIISKIKQVHQTYKFSSSNAKTEFLGRGRFICLSYLSKYRQGVYVNEFVDKLHFGSGRIANILKELEKRDYIVRSYDKFDKRKRLVKITSKGLEKLEEHQKTTNDFISKLIDEIGFVKLNEYVDIYSKIAKISSEFKGGEENV